MDSGLHDSVIMSVNRARRWVTEKVVAKRLQAVVEACYEELRDAGSRVKREDIREVIKKEYPQGL